MQTRVDNDGLTKEGKGKPEIRSRSMKGLVYRYATIVGFAVIFLVFATLSPAFATLSNFITVLKQMTILSFMSLAATCVLIEGGFDLSIGALAGLGAVLACGMQQDGHGMGVALLLPLIVGGAVGFVNALNIVRFGVQPFVATMAMMFILQGAELLYSKGKVITRGITDVYRFLGQGWIGSIPTLVVVLLICSAVLHILLSSTKFGRYAYSVGGNREAARLSGVPVVRCRVGLYLLGGILASAGGILLGARLGSAPVWAGQKMTLPAYAAAYLGSTMLAEGDFTVLGTMVGTLFISGLNNGLTLLGYGWYWQQILLGVILVICVSVSGTRQRHS